MLLKSGGVFPDLDRSSIGEHLNLGVQGTDFRSLDRLSLQKG